MVQLSRHQNLGSDLVFFSVAGLSVADGYIIKHSDCRLDLSDCE